PEGKNKDKLPLGQQWLLKRQGSEFENWDLKEVDPKNQKFHNQDKKVKNGFSQILPQCYLQKYAK
ncbi:unnamed protein product, partial [marine sediment metagenome]